ncbi:MAG: hypothetical protein ACSHYB_13010 [Roseibacillus sp.]
MTQPQFQATFSFFEKIGIKVLEITFSEGQSSCVPGVSCAGGVVSFDREQLEFPGDLYYVAGRIAVSLPEDRQHLDDRATLEPALEMAAMAWAFAAAKEAGIEPELVFHPSGYHGQSRDLIQAYHSGVGPGIPLLSYFGMSENYPSLLPWLRTESATANLAASHQN